MRATHACLYSIVVSVYWELSRDNCLAKIYHVTNDATEKSSLISEIFVRHYVLREPPAAL